MSQQKKIAENCPTADEDCTMFIFLRLLLLSATSPSIDVHNLIFVAFVLKFTIKAMSNPYPG
jgi:hypothetical protein